MCALTYEAAAQSAGCGTSGTYTNYDEYVNFDKSVGGDLEVGPLGTIEIDSMGRYEIYGAVVNNGTIDVDNGAVLSIYGDMLNNGIIKIHKFGTLHFYGNTWKNNSGSAVSDGDIVINTMPGGALNFTATRPNVPPAWTVLSSCLNTYSGGDALQNLDGGNVPMDIELHLRNANNVILINSPTKIEGKLNWDVDNGDIVLENHDLIFTTNASQDGFQPDRLAVTSGTGHVVKENYTGNWIFPVGIADGDYTPAAVNNASPNTMHVLVQDYATSASDEVLSGPTADGMQRTWNIYADLPSGSSVINLQHNSTSNQAYFNDAYNFVTRWGTVVPNPTGDLTVPFGMSAWQTNVATSGSLGNLSSTGTVAGSNMQSRTYIDFATAPSEATAFFTKSSDPLHPLPVQLLSFTGENKDCDVLIKFKTGVENSVDVFQLQASRDGVQFSTITNIKPKGSNSDYSYLHQVPGNGINIYRLVIVEPNGDYTRSPTIMIKVDCIYNRTALNLFPNPARDFITISGIPSASEIRVINIHGRIVLAKSSIQESEILDISQLAAAPYTVQVITKQKEISNLKFEKL